MNDALRNDVHELLVDLLEEHEALFFDTPDLDTIEPNEMGRRISDLIRRTAPAPEAPRLARWLGWIKK